MTNPYQLYLADLGTLLRSQAEAARDSAASAASAGDTAFEQGRLMAYIEVISLMTQQAEAFQIPLGSLNLDGFDPERDLLSPSP